MRSATSISPEKSESVLGDVMTLVKARLSLLVLITTLVTVAAGVQYLGAALAHLARSTTTTAARGAS